MATTTTLGTQTPAQTPMDVAAVKAARRAAHLARAAAEYHGWTGPVSRRYVEALAQARQIERRFWASERRGLAVEAKLARQHAPRWYEWALLSLALLPHRVLPLRSGRGLWSAFWDSWAVGHRPIAERPKLRLGLRRERALVAWTLRRVWSQRADADAAADLTPAQWRTQIHALYEALGVSVEYTTDRWGGVHFVTRDLTPARRAVLTQPSLDALTAGADARNPTPLARLYDPTTQPALPVVRP